MTVQQISAVTLAVQDMARSVDFYGAKLGLEMIYGGAAEDFTTFRIGSGYLNLTLQPQGGWSWWGRAVFYVDDVDAVYNRLVQAGLTPSSAPEDAPWGERFFHISDPDSHELSFAKPLDNRS